MGLGYGVVNPAASHLLARACSCLWSRSLGLARGARRLAWDNDRDPAAPVLASPLESLRAISRNAGVSYSGGCAMLALVTAAGIACFVAARRSRVT